MREEIYPRFSINDLKCLLCALRVCDKLYRNYLECFFFLSLCSLLPPCKYPHHAAIFAGPRQTKGVTVHRRIGMPFCPPLHSVSKALFLVAILVLNISLMACYVIIFLFILDCIEMALFICVVSTYFIKCLF